MIDIIQKCAAEKKIASFYFNKNDNTVHLTGFVHCFNDEEILIAHITPRGEYDGYILNRIEDIYRIEYNGYYEKKIGLLYSLKSQNHQLLRKNDNEYILDSLIDYAISCNKVVSLQLQNDKITGFVVSYANGVILMNTLDNNGISDGYSSISIEEVETFACDGDYEQDLKLLNNSY